MNTFLILYVYVFGCHTTGARFTALSNGLYSLKLYQRVRNSHAPSYSDPATYNAQIRKEICEDIFMSEWFTSSNGSLLDPNFVYLNREREPYTRVYPQVYSPTTGQYTNAYKRYHLSFNGFGYREYSFLCPVKYVNYLVDIVMYAVTKEYNVSAAGQPYKPGRFVTIRRLRAGFTFRTILAEEPALVPIWSSVDVERYYRNVRRHIEPAPGSDLDPLCRLISDNENDIENQHFRICAAVLRSDDLRNIGYPAYYVPELCVLREVSFRVNGEIVARDGAAGERYYERMTRCYARNSWGDRTYVYVSRAYRSNQVFVYSHDIEDDKIYLVNLSISMSIVDELNLFDFFE